MRRPSEFCHFSICCNKRNGFRQAIVGMSDHFFDCDFLRQNAGWKNYRHLGIILHNFLRSKILDSRSAAERNDFYTLLVLQSLFFQNYFKICTAFFEFMISIFQSFLSLVFLVSKASQEARASFELVVRNQFSSMVLDADN